ncbi:MAG: amidohydrolase family protein [Mycobacteriales bacterium]
MSPAGRLGQGLALLGRVWPGGAAAAYDDGVVLVGPDGRIAGLGPAGVVDVPEGYRPLGGSGNWVGPGVVDAHVHLAFGSPEEMLRGGVVGVRDLGAPPELARQWRTTGSPPPGLAAVSVAGPILTGPGGYPSRSWGSGGFAAYVDSPASARDRVRELVAAGVDLVKIALEPAGGPVLTLGDARAVVEAAHAAGLRVSAHALSGAMVDRALDARVDELAHTPTGRLPAALVERVAAAGIPVVSTLATFRAGGAGRRASRNAAALHAAGVELVYGTDLGNAGTRPGVDPRELVLLAEAGLGPLGALRSATERAARLVNLPGCSGLLRVGEPAAVVVLAADPIRRPEAWRQPTAVIANGWLTGSGC